MVAAHPKCPRPRYLPQASPPRRAPRHVDTVAAMERRGSITAGMADAGRRFQAQFAMAQLDPLKAVDWTRPRTTKGFRPFGGTRGLGAEGSRTAIWNAVLAVGGLGSPGGSVLWHVVGWEKSLKEWALEQGWNGRRITQEAASGILIATLGMLEAHYAPAGSE